MTNKLILETRIKNINESLFIGCYDNAIDKLTKKAINELAKNIFDESDTDIVIVNRGKQYIVSVSVISNEVDFTLYTKSEYLNQFGEEYEHKFE